MNYTREENKWDKKISWGVAAYFFFHALLTTFRISTGIESRLPSFLSGALIIGFLLIGIREVIRRSSEILVISYVIGFAVYTISFLMAISRQEQITPILRWSAFPTFVWWIPVGVWAYSVKSSEVLYNCLLKISIPISFFWFVTLFSSGASLVGDDPEHSYDMMLGIGLLFPCLFHLNEFSHSRRVLWLIIGVIEAITIFLYGNRGPLICLFVFILYRFMFTGNNLFIKIIVAATLLLLMVYQDVFIQHLVTLLDSKSINSRTLNLLVNGSINDTSGRDALWAKCFDMIKERPILGWGIGGETTELAFRMGHSASHSFSAHNGLIQNWLHFGVVLGSFVSLLFIIPFFRPFKFKNDKCLQGLIIILMSYYASRFISSSGFFVDPEISVFFYLFYCRKTNPNLQMI